MIEKGYTFEPNNNGMPRESVLYMAYENDSTKMFDASVYSDKVQEQKKNEFMRLLNFLGAKTVNIDDVSSEATAVDKSVGVKVGIDPVNTAGAGAGHSANAAATAKFKVHIVTGKADKNIQKLRDFIEKEECEAPADLVPFFKGKKYMFIKGEATWQQMAYNRILSDQESVACSVTYETTQDTTISANAAFLADAFSVAAGKYESKACSTTVTYAVIFHDAAVGTKSTRTRPSSRTDSMKGPKVETLE